MHLAFLLHDILEHRRVEQDEGEEEQNEAQEHADAAACALLVQEGMHLRGEEEHPLHRPLSGYRARSWTELPDERELSGGVVTAPAPGATSLTSVFGARASGSRSMLFVSRTCRLHAAP